MRPQALRAEMLRIRTPGFWSKAAHESLRARRALNWLLSAWLLSAWLLSAWLLGACGGQTVRTEDHLNRAFAQIQLHEAKLDAHRVGVWDRDTRCARACTDAEGVCEQSRHICAIAHEVMDHDAVTRCRMAVDTCREGRQCVGARCSCARPSK